MDALRPLSLDQFAAMTAEMEAGVPRDRVLEAASVSQEQWDLTQETWLLRMAKQGQQRKLALLDRYNELLAKHRKAAQRKMRAEKRKLKGPMPVPPEAVLSQVARSRLDDGGATFQKPSFSEGSAPFVAPVQPVAGPAWMPAGGIVVPVVPSVVTAPAPVVAPPPVIAAAPTPDEDDEVGQTAVGAAVPTGPAWLQAAAAQAAPEPSVEITATGERSPLAGAAPAWLSAKAPPRNEPPRPPPPSNPGLPAPAGPAWLQSGSFPAVVAQPPPQAAGDHGGGSAAPAAEAKRPKRGATLMTEGPSPWAAPAKGDGAAKGDGLPFQRGAAPSAPAAAATPAAGGLPFQRAQAAGPQPAPAAPAGAADPLPFQRASTVPQPQGSAGAPGALPFQRAAASSQPPQAPAATAGGLPFQKAQTGAHTAASQPQAAPAQPHAAAPAGARAATPKLSLEQLAWLQAQVEMSAELGRTAREQLGLSEPEYAAERAFWQSRFQQDRASVERYSQLFYHYRRAR